MMYSEQLMQMGIKKVVMKHKPTARRCFRSLLTIVSVGQPGNINFMLYDLINLIALFFIPEIKYSLFFHKITQNKVLGQNYNNKVPTKTQLNFSKFQSIVIELISLRCLSSLIFVAVHHALALVWACYLGITYPSGF